MWILIDVNDHLRGPSSQSCLIPVSTYFVKVKGRERRLLSACELDIFPPPLKQVNMRMDENCEVDSKSDVRVQYSKDNKLNQFLVQLGFESSGA